MWTMSETDRGTWWTYVRHVSGDVQNKDIAEAAGVDSSQVSRWSKGEVPRAKSAAAFARAYGRSPVEAFIAAGYIELGEVETVVEVAHSLSERSDDELVGEIARRLARANRIDLADNPEMLGDTPLTGNVTPPRDRRNIENR